MQADKKLTLVLIDDSAIQASRIAKAIQQDMCEGVKKNYQMDFVCLDFMNPFEFLEQFETIQPDIVMVDLNLAERINGLSLIFTHTHANGTDTASTKRVDYWLVTATGQNEYPDLSVVAYMAGASRIFYKNQDLKNQINQAVYQACLDRMN